MRSTFEPVELKLNEVIVCSNFRLRELDRKFPNCIAKDALRLLRHHWRQPHFRSALIPTNFCVL